ncbi:MAG: extracellular solute-binding protein [Anaerolineaceae bacterium]|nr:MAG: extracellular solute-binding protein [Anaerolineaceae bacterium]
MKISRILLLLVVGILILSACQPAEPETVEVTRVVTETEEVQVEVTRVVTETIVEEGEEVEVTRIVEVASEPEMEALPYEGVELNILTFTGPQIAEPLQRRGPDFEAMTGAKINVIIVPFSDLYQQILTDVATETNSYDGWVFAPQWMGDFIVPGYVEDLTSYVAADETIEWEDVAPFFRDFSATYEGNVYTIPLDGDFHMGYFRTDLLADAGLEAPQTWDDYLEIAATFHGQDLNGDGDPDYGSCISKKRAAQAYWFITSVAGSMLQSQGTAQGAFFDTETMEPLVDNEAFRKAMEIYKETTQYGPPDELNLDVGDTRSLFTTGRCALSMDWGDIGPLAIDPETSTVIDQVGAMVLPGSTEVLDRETGTLVACDETTCPYAIDGINYAPFAAFGGWSGGVNATIDDVKKAAAYDFFSFMSMPENANVDVTIGQTGFNPYRTSQFLNREAWVEAGMSAEAAANYLGAIEDSLNSPNMILDLRVPQNQRYQQVVLDTAIAQYLADELSLDEAIQQIYVGWEEITEELGREDQLTAYKASIGAE